MLLFGKPHRKRRKRASSSGGRPRKRANSSGRSRTLRR